MTELCPYVLVGEYNLGEDQKLYLVAGDNQTTCEIEVTAIPNEPELAEPPYNCPGCPVPTITISS